MLISFRTANFLSFNDEVEFSMLAGQPRQLPSHVIHHGEGRSQIDILKSAVIYGANASGKSNLIKAMDFARNIIVNGLKSETTFNKHFRLDPTNIDKPTKFEFEFKLDEKIYAYGFSIYLVSQNLISEWLVEVGKTTDKPIFEREVLENGQSKFKVHLKLTGKIKTRFDVYQEDVLDNQLFLTELSDKNLKNEKNINVFIAAITWFMEIQIIFPNHTLNMFSFKNLNTSDKAQFIEVLKDFDTNILNISYKKSDLDSNLIAKIPDKNLFSDAINDVSNGNSGAFTIGNNDFFLSNEKGKIQVERAVVHQSNNNIEFEIDELSDGVRRLLDIVPILISLKKEKAIFIIDEIDRSLHPELTRKLLEIFHTTTEGVESQLIVTTHESSLLDLNLLRRDEIWFAEKNETGESHFYSLEEFKPRHDIELRKAYLLGRFGAIPFISDVNSLGWTKNTLKNSSQPTPTV